MAQYRLLAPHVTSQGHLLDAGTVVGDDTPWPWPEELVNAQMEGVDDSGREVVARRFQELYHRDPPTVIGDGEPPTVEPNFDEGEPVSEQQRHEREHGSVVEPRHVSVAPTQAGVVQPPPLNNPRDIDMAESTQSPDMRRPITRPPVQEARPPVRKEKE